MKTRSKHWLARIWRRRITPRVIYYHSIHPSAALSLPPVAFREQLGWLRRQGFCFLTFSDLVQRALVGRSEPKTVSITFDDGYADNYQYAFPILQELGVPATFFVVSQMIEQAPKAPTVGNLLYLEKLMLTKEQLTALAAAGMEIGSHTRSHVHVHRTLLRSRAEAFDELAGSKQEIESIISSRIVSFAYPNGQKGVFDASTRELVAEAGYRYAATTIWGSVGETSDPLEVSRMEIRHDDSFDTFCAKMNGQFDFMRYIHLVRDGSRWWGY